jgi:hypothetical protein
MPRGGLRHRKTADEHRINGTYRADRHGRGFQPVALKPARPPSPPNDLAPVERGAWLEVRGEVIALGTYTRADFSAFRLAVKALTLVYECGPEVKATSRRALIANASAMLGRFGADPVSRRTVDVPKPPTARDDELTELELFGRPGLRRIRGS